MVNVPWATQMSANLVILGRQQNENMPMLKQGGYPVLAPSVIPATGGKYHDPPGIAVSLCLKSGDTRFY
jgi:hypothetical protein